MILTSSSFSIHMEQLEKIFMEISFEFWLQILLAIKFRFTPWFLENFQRFLSKLKWLRSDTVLLKEVLRTCLFAYSFSHFVWVFSFFFTLLLTQQALRRKFTLVIRLVYFVLFLAAKDPRGKKRIPSIRDTVAIRMIRRRSKGYVGYDYNPEDICRTKKIKCDRVMKIQTLHGIETMWLMVGQFWWTLLIDIKEFEVFLIYVSKLTTSSYSIDCSLGLNSDNDFEFGCLSAE
jgi:hypothetical protein